MKKRAMKKWIPKNTLYCYDVKKGRCKWLHYLGFVQWNKSNCEFAETCKQKECNCKTSIMKCDYLGIVDSNDETLLWDSCKECGISENWR